MLHPLPPDEKSTTPTALPPGFVARTASNSRAFAAATASAAAHSVEDDPTLICGGGGSGGGANTPIVVTPTRPTEAKERRVFVEMEDRILNTTGAERERAIDAFDLALSKLPSHHRAAVPEAVTKLISERKDEAARKRAAEARHRKPADKPTLTPAERAARFAEASKAAELNSIAPTASAGTTAAPAATTTAAASNAVALAPPPRAAPKSVSTHIEEATQMLNAAHVSISIEVSASNVFVWGLHCISLLVR